MHITACRHQDSQESSGDDKIVPYRVQACAPPHAIRTARSPKMAHAPGRGMAPFCRHRTIPGCPDAYRRWSTRSNPRLMRGAPPIRTAACARRPLRHGSIGARFASRHCKIEAFFLYPHTIHLSHHSDDRLCRQHKVWIRLRSPTQHARPPPGALSQALRGALPDRPISG